MEEQKEITWGDVISPRIQKMVDRLSNKTITPEGFKATLAELNALSGPERLEFIMLQVMFRTAR